jgi:hypothetical protein
VAGDRAAVVWVAWVCTRLREVAVSEEGVWRSKSANGSEVCFASNGGGGTARRNSSGGAAVAEEGGGKRRTGGGQVWGG